MQKYSLEAAVAGAAVSLEKVKGDIVTQTLDKLNETGSCGNSKKSASAQNAISSSYDFNKSVLSAAYEGKGSIIDSKP